MISPQQVLRLLKSKGSSTGSTVISADELQNNDTQLDPSGVDSVLPTPSEPERNNPVVLIPIYTNREPQPAEPVAVQNERPTAREPEVVAPVAHQEELGGLNRKS